MKKKRSKWNSARLFNIHKNIFVFLNMIIWLNMFLVIGVMNRDLPFSVFEKFVMDSMMVAVGLTVALIVHYVVHTWYLASKWQSYEKQQSEFNFQTHEDNLYQRDFSHLQDHYKEEVSDDSSEDPIGLQNGNRM